MEIQNLEAAVKERPDSPLIVRLASEYLLQNRSSEARQLAHQAIEKFPNYATAYLVIARAHAAEENFHLAIQALDKAESLVPDSLILSQLRNQWHTSLSDEIPVQVAVAEPEVDPPADLPSDAIRQGSPALTESFANAAISKPDKETIADTTNFPEPANAPEVIPIGETVLQVEQNHLEAPSVVSPPLPPLADDGAVVSSLTEEGRIVSRTLAEIYATQGAYEEAILTYKLLKRQRPEQSKIIEQRIGELQEVLRQKLPPT